MFLLGLMIGIIGGIIGYSLTLWAIQHPEEFKAKWISFKKWVSSLFNRKKEGE